MKDEDVLTNEQKLEDLIQEVEAKTVDEIMKELKHTIDLKEYPLFNISKELQNKWMKTET